jgi:uncharacterized protein
VHAIISQQVSSEERAMERMYQHLFEQHLIEHRQMIFVMGPRQAGKTTVAQNLVAKSSSGSYYNWDNINDRELILSGPKEIAKTLALESIATDKLLLVFDEIHKYGQWRDFLKGLYDSYPNKLQVLVTGSAKLDVFNRGGDSLMGRYFPFHFHPLSVAEIIHPKIKSSSKEYSEQPSSIDEDQFDALFKFGGYPDPFLKQSEAFSRRWKKLRNQQLFSEDIRDLTRIQDIHRLELLAEKLKHHVGSLTTYHTLSKLLRVSDNTIRVWLDTLKSLYYCFDIRPWSTNVTRSLLKEPKYYLWDWSLCEDEGKRAENMIALHLLKAVHYWNDIGLADYGLYFVRDKEKREVDFLVTKENKPWMLVEVKLNNNKGVSKSLHYFNNLIKPTFSFQVVLNMDFVNKNCFEEPGVWIVPAKTFLSQLV